jgi:hypothetical protein
MPLALVALLALAGSATAASDPDTKEVRSTVLFFHGEDPADPGHCAAAAFAPWKDEKGWVAQNVTWTIRLASGSTREESLRLTAPYNDVFKFGAITWTSPAGSHWSNIALTYADGPGRDDCAEYDAKHQQAIVDQAATVSLYITDDCRTARDSLAAAKKKTRAARAALSGKRGAKRAAAKRRLNAAKAKQAKAQKAYDKTC